MRDSTQYSQSSTFFLTQKKWGQKKKSDDIMEWLGVGSTSVLKRETENEHENEGKAVKCLN